MDAFKLAFDTIIVGVLALPWLFLVDALYYSGGMVGWFLRAEAGKLVTEESSASAKEKPSRFALADPIVASAVGVVLIAVAYFFGSAVSRIAQDFFSDDHIHLVTDDSIRTRVYCDASLRKSGDPLGAQKWSIVADHVFDLDGHNDRAIPDLLLGCPGVQTFTGTVAKVDWYDPHVVIHVKVTDASGQTRMSNIEAESPVEMEKNGWTNSTLKEGDKITIHGYRVQSEFTAVARMIEQLPSGTKLLSSPIPEGKWFQLSEPEAQLQWFIQQIFYLQESSLLERGVDTTNRISQLHEQIIVLRGAAFDGLVALALCAFGLCATTYPRALVFLPGSLLLYSGYLLWEHWESGSFTEPPYAEITIMVLGIAGGVAIWRGLQGHLKSPRLYQLLFWPLLLLTPMAYFAWWWTEVLYDQLILYSFVAVMPAH